MDHMGRNVTAVSQLSEMCRECPYVDKCRHKRMESIACIIPDDHNKMGRLESSAESPMVADMVEPLAVKHDYRDIKVAEGMTVTIDIEDIKKKMIEEFYKGVGLVVLS